MPEPFTEIFDSQLGKSRSEPLSKQLEGLCERIARILALPELSHLPVADEQRLNELIRERIGAHRDKILAVLGSHPKQTIDPSLVEAARREISDEEAVAVIREFHETGGLTFAQLIDGLETHIASE